MDRIRVASNKGRDLRVHPGTGAVASVDGACKYPDGAAPGVTGSAYRNRVAGATSAVLDNTDAAAGALVTQNPPTDGVPDMAGPLVNVDLSGLAGLPLRQEHPAGRGPRSGVRTGGRAYASRSGRPSLQAGLAAAVRTLESAPVCAASSASPTFARIEKRGRMSRDRMRIERDSLGEVEVPAGALYGAQTQRALENFQLSGFRFPRPFLWALGLIKRTAAEVNAELGLLDSARAAAIATVAGEVERGGYDDHFPLDVFQTGSGTSTNMNANEVIAALAARPSGRAVHPNDHVNLGQSSNDVIPSAARASAARELAEDLLPALGHLADSLAGKAAAVGEVVKTGRTHLMDAVPIRLGQEMGAWESQIRDAAERLRRLIPSLCALPLGGTAVGTGLNSHPEFGARVARRMAGETGLPFTAAANPFAAIASQDAAVELSGQLRGAALALLKIANDLRWMNSGPEAGLNEIALPALQPGSSMMPGKVNPVIPEAVAMICTQVTGFDAAIAAAAASGNFQLNVMQPLVAWNLLTAIRLLSNAARSLADRAVVGLTVNEERIRAAVGRNPALVTALARRIGYDRCAAIAREAAATGRSLEEVAREQSGLSAEELRKMLDPARMTQPGFPE